MNIVTNITVTTSFQYGCESKMIRWNWRCKCLPRESFVAFVNEGVRWGESCSNLASKLEGCAFDVYMRLSSADRKKVDKIQSELMKEFERENLDREIAVYELNSRRQKPDE